MACFGLEQESFSAGGDCTQQRRLQGASAPHCNGLEKTNLILESGENLTMTTWKSPH